MRVFRISGAIIWAIPFYFIWNYLAPIYAPQLPPQYLDIPFWHIAGVFALIAIVQAVLIPRRLWRRRDHFGGSCHHRGGWGGGRDYYRFGKFAKYCRRGYWTEKYYHKSV